MTERLEQLRNVMRINGWEGVLLTDRDPYMSEYPSEHWKWRKAFSGFTGSNGVIWIGEQGMILWTDSRYALQAKAQTKGIGASVVVGNGDEGRKKFAEHIISIVNREEGKLKIACIEEQWTADEITQLTCEFKQRHRDVEWVDAQQIEMLWKERPAPSEAKAWVYEERYAGMNWEVKVEALRREYKLKTGEAILVGKLDEWAWLMNLRGRDVRYCPVCEGVAIVEAKRVSLYVRDGKIGEDVVTHEAYREAIRSEKLKIEDERNLSRGITDGQWKRIYIKKESLRWDWGKFKASIWKVEDGVSCIEKMKAVKNKTEIEGIREAVRKDGAAMVRGLKRIEASAIEGTLTEREVGKLLRKEREKEVGFIEESFETIAGWKEHGAVVHYVATEQTNKEIKGDGLLLIDSGGQYMEGTTDITRTIGIGTPSDEEKRSYTIVLQGMVRLGMSVFPKETSGGQIDCIARMPLWRNGMNYGHGTGHGIGHCLNVHEGPQAFRQELRIVPLEEGMITSDEPGFYKEGSYGIRHENMTLVKKSRWENMLELETLTLCPFDEKCVEWSLLESSEKEWLRTYHGSVWEGLKSRLEGDDREWLRKKCEIWGKKCRE